MKLTHENVRAALANAIATASVIDDTDATTFVLLAEQWLAAHTVRWDGRFLQGGDDAHSGVSTLANGRWRAATDFDAATFDTEAEARAWCEEQAREAGFEVER